MRPSSSPAHHDTPVHCPRQICADLFLLMYAAHMSTDHDTVPLSANRRMVSLVRESRGWSQAELARAAGVTQGYVSKVENGLVQLTDNRLDEFAHALGCPTKLLTNHDAQRGLEVSCMFHRRRHSRMTVTTAKKIEAVSHLTRITVDSLLTDGLQTPTALQRMDIDEYGGDAEEVARIARARWNVPSGPVDSVYEILDSLGVVVVIRELDSTAQDAFSTWPPGHRPLMVVRKGLSADRERFTVSHELGHILMHSMPNESQEQQADLFAAGFLMPADEIRGDLQGLTTRDFDRLLDLKAQWRVSVAALIQRAKTLEIISDRQFREFRIKLSRLGWNTVEPIDIPGDAPRLLDTVVAGQYRDQGLTEAELASRAYMTPGAFRKHYLDHTSLGQTETGI